MDGDADRTADRVPRRAAEPDDRDQTHVHGKRPSKGEVGPSSKRSRAADAGADEDGEASESDDDDNDQPVVARLAQQRAKKFTRPDILRAKVRARPSLQSERQVASNMPLTVPANTGRRERAPRRSAW